MFDFTWLSHEENAVLRTVTSRDWRSDALELGELAHEDLATRAVALGAIACHGFANAYAISAHPAQLVVRHLNQVTGSPADQVRGVTTVRQHIPELFDWSRLPEPLTAQHVLELIDRLFEVGPFGFRGPAAAHVPDHLTTLDGETRVVELLGAGYRCPSRRFLARCLDSIKPNYLAVAVREPAHSTLHTLHQDYGAAAGVLMLAHRDEDRARRAYPQHDLRAPTVLDLHSIGRASDGGVLLRVAHHGSLHLEQLRRIVGELGLGVEPEPHGPEWSEVREKAELQVA